MSENTKWVTAREVAQAVGLPVYTVRSYLKKYEKPAHVTKIGRGYMSHYSADVTDRATKIRAFAKRNRAAQLSNLQNPYALAVLKDRIAALENKMQRLDALL